MKHKRKKSHKEDRKHKHRKKSSGKKHRDKVARTDSRKGRKMYHSKNLLDLAMASGFQATSSGSSTQCIDLDDEVVVVYDKKQETIQRQGSSKKTNESKFCLTKPFDVKPLDIPLPPENWVSNSSKKAMDSIRLEDIPLPPSPNTYERLRKESESEGDSEAKQQKKLLTDIRKWVPTELGENLQQDAGSSSKLLDNSFTIMSYNVLAQSLLEEHHYLYRRNDERALDWKVRSKVLWKEIIEADADILCLQEVQASHLDSFYSKLKDLGYAGLFKRRSVNNYDGCAIYFKTDKFKLVDSALVEYYQNYKAGLFILDRHNIAIIAKLGLCGSQKSHESVDEIVVATTHLLYNPRRNDVRLAQTQVLLAELDRLAYIGFDKEHGKPKYLPIIVTGDFNLKPDTPVYKLIVEGNLQYSCLAAKSLAEPFYGQALQEVLLPFELQISNSCQHLGLLLHRLKLENNSSRKEKVHISEVSKLFNSETYKSYQSYTQTHSTIPLLYEEDFCGRVERGFLFHRLNLQSVYKHQGFKSSKYIKEATTFQDDWITVDYIFYSGTFNDETHQVEEGKLKLLSSYSLPSRGQCNELKSIPNLVCGSDHFSLMARFIFVRDK
ncbi:Protein angel-like protein 2 [Frankliniella fusca]|uniref:Protein angel-like protein 2 n=1 Tax=Frankliniella fusca TaxID=407009 RepID=A0AAE1LDH4_9NEOP|nr:Protein angel-like protein 2 [Frankliniella fusca]